MKFQPFTISRQLGNQIRSSGISWPDLESEIRRNRPSQSPTPGFREKYRNLSGFPTHSLKSAGASLLTVIFGHMSRIPHSATAISQARAR